MNGRFRFYEFYEFYQIFKLISYAENNKSRNQVKMYVRNYVLILFFLSNIIYVRSNSNQFITKTAISSSCFKFLNVPFTTNVVHFFHHDTKPTLEQKQQRSTIHCKKVDRWISEYSRAKAYIFFRRFPWFWSIQEGCVSTQFIRFSLDVRTYVR